MLILPLKSDVFLGELSQWFGDITEIGNEFCTIRRKLRTSPTDFGGRASCIALTLAGSGETPCAEKTSPKKVSESLWNSHFSGEIVSPESASRHRTACRA